MTPQEQELRRKIARVLLQRQYEAESKGRFKHTGELVKFRAGHIGPQAIDGIINRDPALKSEIDARMKKMNKPLRRKRLK